MESHHHGYLSRTYSMYMVTANIAYSEEFNTLEGAI